MSNIFHIFIQGFTELLPVSSSMHLALWETWCQLPTEFVVALHTGSGLGLCLRLRTYTASLFKKNHYYTLWRQGIISLIPVSIVGVTLDATQIRSMLHTPRWMGVFSIVGALALIISDRLKPCMTSWPKLHNQKLWLWAWGQCLGLFSGFSRLGAALIFGRIAGLDRKQAVMWGYISGLWTLGASTAWLFIKTMRHNPTFWCSKTLIMSLLLTSVVTYGLYPYTRRLLSTQKGLWLVAIYRIALGIYIIKMF